MNKPTYTISLNSINRDNWGAPENVTLLVTDAQQREIAKITYDFSEHVEGSASVEVTTTNLAPADPIMLQAYAFTALYQEQANLDAEFLADVFIDHEADDNERTVSFTM